MQPDHADSPAGGSAAEASEAPAFAPSWARLEEQPSFSPVRGITMRSLTGGRLMLNWVRIEPHSEVPRHGHPHEQAGLVLEGSLELTIGDETRVLRPGDAYTCPPNMAHRAVTGDEGCIVLDVFTPPREDYIALLTERDNA